MAPPSSSPEMHDSMHSTKQESPDTIDQPSPQNDNNAEQEQTGPRPPIQKRRRVTRACDECRRKKIKCDGKQPCTHCTVYSYECTYDQPSNRRRNAAPQYIEALESQLKRAKTILSAILPGIDLDDPNLDASIQNGMLPQIASARLTPSVSDGTGPSSGQHVPSTADDSDARIESMVRATGQLEIDEQGKWDYHGHSSGFTFLRRMREQLGDIMSSETRHNPLSYVSAPSAMWDSPHSTQESPFDGNSSQTGIDLPPKPEARKICEAALEDACGLLRIVHLPTFYGQFDKMYETSTDNYGNEENTFLPLLYAVLAYGTLFVRDQALNYEDAIDEGFKYYKASRQLLDIAECRDLPSLQAVVVMTLFLQSSAKLSTCYSYIGLALRSALRMGLHRSFNANFNPIEAETRKRVFWAIRKMDIYVSAVLGLPTFLRDDEIDQEFPVEVEDEYITSSAILPPPEGHVSVMHAANAHNRLIDILAKVVQYIYPPKGAESVKSGNDNNTYSVSYAKIREIEKDLQDWQDQLAPGLRPGGDAQPMIMRVQQLLRIAYAHTQMMLYRPFLHYASQNCQTNGTDQRAYACAYACVSVSRNVVHIASEMNKRGLLGGGYWFTMYTSFFAILSLVFFALENPSSPTSEQILRDATEGKETMAQLAKRSIAAARCSETLTVMFERLPGRLKRGRELKGPVRKRRQAASPPAEQRPNSAQSSMESPFQPGPPRRAITFQDGIPIGNVPKRPPFGPHVQHPYNSLSSNSSSHEGTPPTVARELFGTAFAPTSPTSAGFGFGMGQGSAQLQSQDSYPPTPVCSAFMDVTSGIPIADMSAMMFPSEDPLAYPNQPMTMFENNNFERFGLYKDAAQAQFKTPESSNTPLSMGSGMYPMPPGGGAIRNDSGLAGDVTAQAFPPPAPMFFYNNNPQQSMVQYQQQLQQQQQRQHLRQVHGAMGQVGEGSAGRIVNFDEILRGDEWAGSFVGPGPNLGFGPGGVTGNNDNGMWPRDGNGR